MEKGARERVKRKKRQETSGQGGKVESHLDAECADQS